MVYETLRKLLHSEQYKSLRDRVLEELDEGSVRTLHRSLREDKFFCKNYRS